MIDTKKINKNNNNNNRIQLIKLTIIERFQTSSIIAFQNVVRSEFMSIRIIWLIFSLLSSCWCSWFIFRNIADYLSHSVITKTLVKHENGLIFPIVGICNLNPFNTEYAKIYLNEIFDNNDPTKNNYYKSLYYANFMNMGSNSQFDRRLFGQNLTDFIVECTFGYKNCDLTRDFEYYYDVNYGNCFRYNSGKDMLGRNQPKKYVYASGTSSALEIVFLIGSVYENSFSFSNENGFILFINNQSVDSNYHEGIAISTGTCTRIIVSSYTNIRQPKPYSVCIADLSSIDSYHSDCYKKTFDSSNLDYDYTTCFFMCYQKFLGQICGCQSTYYNEMYFKTMRKCKISVTDNYEDADMKCEQSLWDNFTMNHYINLCDCPIECEQTGYNYKISVSEYPTKRYADYLIAKNSLIKSKMPNATHQELKQSIGKVKIFYDELIHTIITEEVKMELADLISNAGGTLGLFLGLLLLIYFKLFEF